jgi:hypothetical protein
MRSLPIPDVAPNERLNGLVANLGMHSTEVFGRLVAHRVEIGRSVVRSGQVEVFLKPAKLREKIEGDRLAEPLDEPSLISARDRRHAPAGPHDECVAQELGIRTHNSRLPAVATPRQYGRYVVVGFRPGADQCTRNDLAAATLTPATSAKNP